MHRPEFPGGAFVVSAIEIVTAPRRDLRPISSTTPAPVRDGSRTPILRSVPNREPCPNFEGLYSDGLPGALTFNGDAGQVIREIGDGETVAVNLDGAPLFDDIFSSLIAFRDGLRANDRTAINVAAGDVGREIDTVLTARGEVGARMRRLESAWDRLAQEELSLRTLISGLEEVDITAEVVELQVRDTAFQAALSATGRSLGRSLLDFLR